VIKHSLVLIGTFLLADSSLESLDIYGPKPFYDILESSYTKVWVPTPISNIESRKHVVFLDASTKSYFLSIDISSTPQLILGSTATIANGEGTYGDVLKGMFQILDNNISILNDGDIGLSGEYSIQPELFSYYSIDVNSSLGVSTGSEIIIRDRGTLYMEGNAAYLAFTFIGNGSSTKLQAASRYKYDIGTASFIKDDNWLSSHWIKLDGESVVLTNIEDEGTSFYIANALELIDVSIPEDFNPKNAEWATNSFASYPENHEGTSEVKSYDEIIDIDEKVDSYYRRQFRDNASFNANASGVMDTIEMTLINQESSLRYPKEVYLKFRENMLEHKYGSITMYNAKYGEPTVKDVYFTNAKDQSGVFHPFMVIASYNSPGGPQFLIDVTKPPGDGAEGTEYPDQTVTRNSFASIFLIKIPLKHYGDIANLTDNDLTAWLGTSNHYGSLMSDWNDENTGNPVESDVYNYASLSDIGIAIDGVRIYPASNNQLAFTPMDAEITSTGIHVGRGMNYHYHADGHSSTGNGINLYNLSDYEDHLHPPIIGFAYDGIALYGKYESLYNDMDGYDGNLDEYGGHAHGDYGYHYHTFTKEVTQVKLNDPDSTTFTQHFFLVGAWKGKINDIPGFLEVTADQLDPNSNSIYSQYSGVSNCNGNGAVYDQCGICDGGDNCNLDIKNQQVMNSYSLKLPYPNPFNPTTTLSFAIPIDSEVSLSVYNLQGREVSTLIDANMDAGYHSIVWDANSYASGVYFVKMVAGEFVNTQKLMLIK